ncbi:hypothetical protein BGZ76_008018 [Entomortierella beljakovae]|nr:hypothetical protein BGZ76_008018 [Entomortierella beljakovae]
MSSLQHLTRQFPGNSYDNRQRPSYTNLSGRYPPPPISPTISQISNNSVSYLEERGEDDQLRLYINNLDGSTTATQIKEILEDFGEIADVTMDRNEATNKASASLLFEKKPHNIPGLFKAKLNGKFLDIEVVPMRNRTSISSCPAEKMSLGQMLAPSIFCNEFTATLAIKIQFQENRKMLKLTFKRKFAETTIKYQVEMKVQDMEKGCIQIDDFDTKAAITINLRFPPTYWRHDPNMASLDPMKWNESQLIRRVVDIPKEGSVFDLSSTNPELRPVEPNPTTLSSKLGRWTVVHLVVGPSARANMAHFVNLCKKHNLIDMNVEQADYIRVKDASCVLHPQMSLFDNLAFEARYMLESALSTNCIVDYDLTPGVAQILCSLDPLKASMILSQIVSNRRRIWSLEKYLARESKRLAKITCRPRIVPAQCVYLRKLIVTPTTIHLQSPTVETSNRIIRHFSNLSDYFLRVEFSDEGNSRIWSKDSSSNENNAIYNRIFTALTQGIKIGDRNYEFLAFSASQLRDNSAWFFCSQGGNDTVDSIHRWMGDFSHIKSIAKYAARMGQCFSSTRAVDNLSANEVELIDDIERDNQIFSDGCGRISLTLAQKIAHELGKEYVPVAFQIRLGGSKGVLVWHPPLKNKCVHIRRSMKKFDVDHYVLEVIKTSSFISSYLNRQIIILLSALGVPDRVILDLKNKMVQDLEKMESDEITAIRILSQNCDENGTSKMMIDMVRSGFLRRQDPYIKNLLALFKLHMLEELSKKARIFVPDGAYLLGVCDETSKLKEGEIFVRVSSAENPSMRRTITGKCAVVRCPCFHPGDIRVVKAVECPELNHLYDVVVFNTQGNRGIPSMCSGGDLDGDEYTVIWDPNIVNNIKEHSPMNYAGSDSVTSSDVQIHEIKKFFVQYAVSNNLGLIANAHLALSDYLDNGPINGKCIRLAQLHSDAVDFPKSGKPARFTNDLKPKHYPDFMEKPPERSYRSKRILGTIFRECRKQEAFSPKDYNESLNPLLLVDGYEKYLGRAIDLKANFDDEVLYLMNQYGVRSDLEIASGYFMGIDVITNKREHDVRKSIVGAYSIIKRKYRTEFEQEFYAPGSKKIPSTFMPEVEKKAAAWYAACYQNLRHGQTYSFAWVVWDYLCGMAKLYRPPTNLDNPSWDLSPLQESILGSTPNFLPDKRSNTPPRLQTDLVLSQPQYRQPAEMDSSLLLLSPTRELNTDITINGDSVIIGPDVNDDELKAALRY